jgi:hypothetical protein
MHRSHLPHLYLYQPVKMKKNMIQELVNISSCSSANINVVAISKKASE